jgi:hypothetical protein
MGLSKHNEDYEGAFADRPSFGRKQQLMGAHDERGS